MTLIRAHQDCLFTHYFFSSKTSQEFAPWSKCSCCPWYHSPSCILWPHTWSKEWGWNHFHHLEFAAFVQLHFSSPQQTAFIPEFSQISATLPSTKGSPCGTGTWHFGLFLRSQWNQVESKKLNFRKSNGIFHFDLQAWISHSQSFPMPDEDNSIVYLVDVVFSLWMK